MGKIRKDCERRSLRGCAGCPVLHSICSKPKTKSIKKEYNYKMSMEFAREQEIQFFTEVL